MRSPQFRFAALLTALLVISGLAMPLTHTGSGHGASPAVGLQPGATRAWLDDDFEELEDGYDPETDPTSLFNVARAIGLNPSHPTGAGVDIALIDTGIVDVPGLANSRVVRGPDFSFEDAHPRFRALDTNGHGTHLAGILVATDADWPTRPDRTPQRALGIAPDARLVSIKVGVADGGADVSQVIAAINWVIANRRAAGLDIRIISLAYGTDASQDRLADPFAHAVERAWRAGIVVVVAGGNDGTGRALRSPAVDPFVIAVGAGHSDDEGKAELESFSNLGNSQRQLDILAPGRSIVSLRNPGSYSDAYNGRGRVDQDLVRGTGSSQATAVVAAAAALLLEQRPALTPDQVKGILVKSASGETSPGFLNVDKALAAKLPKKGQRWAPSVGLGSIDLARGSVRVADPGGTLDGETDIFGNNWSATAWATDAWTDNRWTGSRWAGDLWVGRSWSDRVWSDTSWSGNEWSGNEWSGNEWATAGWSGNEWSGNEWSGNEWSGNEWSGNQWSIAAWSTGSWGSRP